MKKQVFDYFKNLQELNIPSKDGVFVVYDTENRNRCVEYKNIVTNINGVDFYTKSFYDEGSITEIATSKMYNDLGMINPPAFLTTGTIDLDIDNYYVTTQSVYSAFQDYDIILPSTLFNFIKDELFLICNDRYSHWEILNNPDAKNCLLKYMTSECFEQLVSLYLLDELRSEEDRHSRNYFFYRTKGNKLFEGIIPIDHEFTYILNILPEKREEFNQFLKTRYQSYTPFAVRGHTTNYINRINDIKELINSDKITKEQIELLKSAIEYDFPKCIKATCNSPKIEDYAETTHTAFSYLWEYNRNELGKELDI